MLPRYLTNPANTSPYTVSSARYAKGMMLVRVNDSAAGFKGRASYLVKYVGGRWTNRERGYVLSPAKLRRLETLYSGGYDTDLFSERLMLDGKYVEDPTLRRRTAR